MLNSAISHTPTKERKTFLERQASSKKASFKLLVLLFLVIAAIIAIYYFAIIIFFYLFRENAANPQDYINPDGSPNLWDPIVFLLSVYCSAGLILAGCFHKIKELKRGGRAVAERLGAREVLYNTNISKERQLINIVEELSIAAGISVPEIYILDREPGINAFAAGHCLKDTVIGVSGGALRYLTREEMQGVIAHELSHILNFDMKLNMRLTSWVHGLEYVYRASEGGLKFDPTERNYWERDGIYSEAMYGRTHDSYDSLGPYSSILKFCHPITILIGLLKIFGFFGFHSGQLIKAAFSYNRELLADASATQITRNPASLAGALKKIGALKHGSKIKSRAAEEVCHMFFANTVSIKKKFLSSLRNTHPPLIERILALEPEFDGDFSKVTLKESKAEIHFPKNSKKAAEKEKSVNCSVNDLMFSSKNINNALGSPSWKNLLLSSAFLESLSSTLKEMLHEPHGAISTIFALFIQKEDKKVFKEQIDILTNKAPKGVASETLKIYDTIKNRPKSDYLKIVELSMPALHGLSKDQYILFKNLLKEIASKNNEHQIFLFSLLAVLENNLGNKFEEKESLFEINFSSAASIKPQIITLFSALALSGQTGGSSEERIKEAFNKGLNFLQIDPSNSQIKDKEFCLETLSKSLKILANATYELRFNIVQAANIIINFDEVRSSEELELLRAISETLECPLPAFS